MDHLPDPLKAFLPELPPDFVESIGAAAASIPRIDPQCVETIFNAMLDHTRGAYVWPPKIVQWVSRETGIAPEKNDPMQPEKTRFQWALYALIRERSGLSFTEIDNNLSMSDFMKLAEVQAEISNFRNQPKKSRGPKKRGGGRKHDNALLIRRALVVATQDAGVTGPTPIAQKIEAFADWLEEEKQQWGSDLDHVEVPKLVSQKSGKKNESLSRDMVRTDLAQMANNPELRKDAKRAGTKWGGIEVFKRYLEETDL